MERKELSKKQLNDYITFTRTVQEDLTFYFNKVKWTQSPEKNVYEEFIMFQCIKRKTFTKETLIKNVKEEWEKRNWLNDDQATLLLTKAVNRVWEEADIVEGEE